MKKKQGFWLKAGLIVLILCSVSAYLKIITRHAGEVLASPNVTKIGNAVGQAYFEDHVRPVLERNCSGSDEQGRAICHASAVSGSSQQAAAAPATPPHSLTAAEFQSCQTCHQKSREALLRPGPGSASSPPPVFDYAGAVKYAAHGRAPFSKLLRNPLAALSGGFGLYHKGGEVFRDTNSPDYLILARWVDMENKSVARADAATSEAEVFFAQNVLPVYARNGCFAVSCHIFNHSSFFLDPGMPSDDLALPVAERFSQEQIQFNRMTSKGLIQSVVYLAGDVEQSRVLKKNIPFEKGGVLHKGGNNPFFTGPEDPDYQIVKKWLTLERKEALAPLKIAGAPVEPDQVGQVRGVVFVRTPSHNHRHYLDVGKYLPGGDLYLLKLGPGETLQTTKSKPVNLTQRFHKGRDADIREPDVRYDGRAVIFAMRVGEDDNLNLYEVRLDDRLDYVEGSFRRLTHGPKFVNGVKVHYTDPTFVPDPGDQNAAAGGYNLDKADVVFVTNISGDMVPSMPRGILGEADGGDAKTIIDVDRPEADGAFVGRKIHIVEGTNKDEWRYITAFENRLFASESGGRSFLRVDRPFSRPIDETSIYVIEELAENLPGFLPSYSVYGMKYPEPGREKWTYDQTISRITYGIGQEMDLSVRSTGEVFFSSQRSFTDKYNRPIFHMASCRRHLDTRFSFPTHHGNRGQVPIMADNHEMPTGIDIHAYLDPHTLWESGALGTSDHQLGPNLDPGNPNDFVTGRFDEAGAPRVTRSSIDNTRFEFSEGAFSHPRFLFSSNHMFPRTGPKAVSFTGFSPGGTFRDPFPLPDGDLLVSHYDQPINLLDPNADPEFRLHIVKSGPSFQTPGYKGSPTVEKLALGMPAKKGYSDVQATPIYVRPKEKINAARRPKEEHLIRYPGQTVDDHRPATYLERNYYLIDAIMDDPSPIGKQIASSDYGSVNPMDEVRYVRMVEVLPVTPEEAKALDPARIKNRDPLSTSISNGIHLRKRTLLEQPLEKDGSIKVRVSSKTPVIIQSLNADKMALRQSARLYFFAPNELFTISPARSETFQTCGMCMGAIRKDPNTLFGPSTMFSGQQEVLAMTAAATKPDPLQYASIDFVRDIQPILDRSCAGCHNDRSTPVHGLTLEGVPSAYYTRSYESLHQLEEPGSGGYHRKKYVNERNALAIKSYLVEKMYGRELKAPRRLSGDTPHPSPDLIRRSGVSATSPSEAEKLLLVRWIDLGATFKGGKAQ